MQGLYLDRGSRLFDLFLVDQPLVVVWIPQVGELAGNGDDPRTETPDTMILGEQVTLDLLSFDGTIG